MTRKDFLRWNAAMLGGLTLPSASGAAGVRPWPGPTAVAGAEPLWELVREQFLLDPDLLFVNFGGLGACPLPVLESLERWSRVEERAPNAGHDEAEWNRVREKLAALLSPRCRAENIGLISGATEGVNMIINGLPLEKGDEVITSTHEHVAVNTGLLNRLQRDGIAIRTFEPDRRPGAGNVERIAALVNGRTRLILYSHVTCTTGQRLPDKDVAALARAKGIWFALDGAQAPVNLPFDIVDTGVDFYACSTHKWLMGPKRTGFIYMRDGMFDALRPSVGGGGMAKSFDLAKRELVLQPNAHRFEYGTQNDALFYALGTAVDFVRAARRRPDRVPLQAHGRAVRRRPPRDPGRRAPVARGGGGPDADDRLPDGGGGPRVRESQRCAPAGQDPRPRRDGGRPRRDPRVFLPQQSRGGRRPHPGVAQEIRRGVAARNSGPAAPGGEAAAAGLNRLRSPSYLGMREDFGPTAMAARSRRWTTS